METALLKPHALNTSPESTAKARRTTAPQAGAAEPAAVHDDVAQEAVRLAEELLQKALAQETRAEAKQGAAMGRMMDDERGKAFTFGLVDEVFRSRHSRVQARRFRGLLNEYGVPKYPPVVDRALIGLGGAVSAVAPGVVMPQVAARMRAESGRVIVDGAPAALEKYLTRRAADGFRINLNHLGEAVLGEEEAARRLAAIEAHLLDPNVNYVSVKISAIFSQINLLAWDETLAAIKERLRRLYRAAMGFRSQGSGVRGQETGASAAGTAAPQWAKFVNLDMEEYRDLALTLAAFREVLDEPEFLELSAGVVLQAYLPDSWAAHQELTAWAKTRVARGGAAIKLRLVKGANLAMEAVEAELHGWAPAPYATKAETDANFRRMMEFGCRKENAAAVRLGVASHNLFDVALAMVLRERNGTRERVELEMLEGMANHQARAVRDAAGGLLLYAPAVQENDFLSALAYLIRRLDENTAKENFLRDMFALRPGSEAWERQRERFLEAWNEREAVGVASRRGQESAVRGQESEVSAAGPAAPQIRFANAEDSDWTQNQTREAVWGAIKEFGARNGGERRPALPTLDDVLDTARSYQKTWEDFGGAKRADILRAAAGVMAAQRYTTIACMRIEGKKAIPEADIEVSEAVDFAWYYAQSYLDVLEDANGAAPSRSRLVNAKTLGVVVVTPPWNFPYAIPAGGVLAALMAGNCVILKPAPETVAIAELLAKQLWEAGVPREALQFYPCADGETGKALITDPRVDCVVLTGAYETARMFQRWRPGLNLMAETSGKNALVITAQADRELAVKDLVKSAFGHAGQKCSAASLAIVEAEVYDDPVFRRQLRDAAASLAVGPSTDPRSVVTPLIREPGENLLRALTTNDPGEEWLLEPRMVGDECRRGVPVDFQRAEPMHTGRSTYQWHPDTAQAECNDPCLWSPGIKLGVKPGSWFHRTECFGPVLGVMRAENLEQAVESQNATDYGLTAGLHSLDPREQEYWREHVQAGNLYINRATTGAIVQRQPFGGWKRSSIGPGAKAGGPNYVLSFCRVSDAAKRTEELCSTDYAAAWAEHFAVEHDPSGLKAESNVFRYRRSRGVIVRLKTRDEETIARLKLAAEVTGVSCEISVASEESEDAFIARLPELAERAEFLRTVDGASDKVLAAAHELGWNWIDAPITACGRIELRHWMREQAVSTTMHRYGQMKRG